MDVNVITQLVVNYGVFGSLFVSLFIWTMKESKKREDKLLAALNKYADAFTVLSDDVEDIKQDLKTLKTKD